MARNGYHVTPFRPRLRGSDTGPSRGRRRAVCGVESLPLSWGVPLSTETHAPNRQNRSPAEQKPSFLEDGTVTVGLCPWGSSGWSIRVWSPKDFLVVPTSSYSPGALSPGHLVPRCPSWLSLLPASSLHRHGAEVSSLSPSGPRLLLSAQSCGHVTFSPRFISEPQATPSKCSAELEQFARQGDNFCGDKNSN